MLFIEQSWIAKNIISCAIYDIMELGLDNSKTNCSDEELLLGDGVYGPLKGADVINVSAIIYFVN